MYEAALAVSVGWDQSKSCPHDDLADEARRRGIATTLTLEEGTARFEPARSRLNREPHIGRCYPKIGEQESAELVGAFNDLHPYMLGIAPDRCSRPPWQEQSAARPVAVPSPTSDPVPEETRTSPAKSPPDATTGRLWNEGSKYMIRDQVFISYSHQDKRFLDELRTQLKPYLRKGTITAWSDEQIVPGSKWFDEIKAALANTSAAVMLVGPDFLASDFIHEHELGPLLKEAEAGGVTILWVLIRDCSWKETPLKDYQAVVSPPDKPFASMTKAKRDTAWRKVCEAIKQAVDHP
jgi:hypothetical protein